MPTSVLRQMKRIDGAMRALQALGWKDARNAPRPIAACEVLEIGCVVAHRGCRDAQGRWWVHDRETYPSHPILYRNLTPNGTRTTVPEVSGTKKAPEGALTTADNA